MKNKFKILTLTLALILISTQVVAQLSPAINFIQPPPRQGTPKGTVPAGSRRGCPQTQKPLTALVPVTKFSDNTELRWGLTTQDHPTFWFYIPYESKSVQTAKFSLRDRTNSTLYETDIKLTGTPGVINVSLPKEAPLLSNNQWYRLYLFINISCAPNTPYQKDFAEAWITRETLAPALSSELEKATIQQKANIYAKNGIWYDAITTVAEIRRQNPQDKKWDNLLKSAGL
ncbi:hypothetical protein DSM106972_007180 [Dulcicalothrix desertica PCC 7102]|uniref:DUF928 domain-containing protein n=1 Tax=Dulcicalothrix desertica PCC 7102 TaxID=232991 RepID=A0A3S1CM38_9CYAN|nr:DUF928 domain-containing protein [Dulcicalothrix desertica]RUT10223.1 hypothetical protein DSM106972_007180 [Dulcicalothrix desertica PCC 7102]TWH40799.1 uncharacterized protein DUF928 [Dulcicalothrix desertica PCC 7102]